MNIERLNKIEEIHFAALKLLPGDRPLFLDGACGPDDELRREVESLLAFEDKPAGFLESTPEALAAEMFADRQADPELIGRAISHYEIIKLLGSGGMGEVYLANDTKLRRKVALKLLPPQFSADHEREKRFVKEARAISALNHPNIITIYEIEDSAEFSFIATEYIDGLTLRERIAERPFGWQEAVGIAIQVASALASAHSVGIIHRDIKPGNIMIRSDGIVKVLDFGLAKLTAPDAGDLATREHTAPHRVMGTINYMSPEQALGEPIDSRTDIFSFGVVLYEMLTGEVPFAGPSDAAIFNATINRPLPSVCALRPDVPSRLEQIIKHSLEKEPRLRYRAFEDIRTDLKSVLRDPQTASLDHAFTNETVLQTDPDKIAPAARTNEKAVPRSTRSAFWLIVLLIVGVASTAGAYWRYFYVQAPAATDFRSTKLDVITANGSAVSAAISPDGNYIAYARDEVGNQSLWLRQTAIAGDTQIVPPGPTKYDHLKFSRDGRFIYFVGTEGPGQPSSLYQLTTLGLNRRRIITGVDSQISFSPDGQSVAFERESQDDNSIIIADEAGGNERILITRKAPQVYGDEVSWSPDGKLIAVPTLTHGATYAGGMAVVDVATGSETPIPLKEEKLLRISQLAWINDGRGLIYLPYAADMGQRYQIRYAAYPSGEVQNVTNDLTSYEDISLTADCRTLVAVQRQYTMGIWLTPENDFTAAVPISSKTAADDGERGVAWTRDGKIVFVSSEGGAQNIWRMNADGSDPKPLTTDYKVGKLLPTLTIGEGSINYYSRAQDPVTKELITGNTFFQMDTDGQNVRRLVETHDVAFAAASANRDWVVYAATTGGELRIWKTPAAGGDAVRLTDVDSTSPVISRDGKLVAYLIREKDQPVKLGIMSIDGGAPKRVIELPATDKPAGGIAWNKAGNGILFVNTLGTTSNIWTQPLDGTGPKPLTAFKEFQIAAFALNAEGTRLAVARGSRNRDVVLMKDLRH